MKHSLILAGLAALSLAGIAASPALAQTAGARAALGLTEKEGDNV